MVPGLMAEPAEQIFGVLFVYFNAKVDKLTKSLPSTDLTPTNTFFL